MVILIGSLVKTTLYMMQDLPDLYIGVKIGLVSRQGSMCEPTSNLDHFF